MRKAAGLLFTVGLLFLLSVLFLRFELGSEAAAAVMKGASVSAGIDHPAYTQTVSPLPENIRDSLKDDLN